MSDITGRVPVPIAALVIGYKPDLAVVDALLLRLMGEAAAVFLIDNGGSQAYLSGSPEEKSRVHYINMGGNQGLGAALNRGMAEARAKGFRYVTTFDQDSAPPCGMVTALLRAMQARQAEDPQCVAVGPVFHDQREAGERSFPVYREQGGRICSVPVPPGAGLLEVDMLITSGMLVDSNAWEAGLKYDDGLMVDYTDTDWCFRARAAGKRLFVLAEARMAHSVSDARPVRILGVHFLRYSPIRRYYYFRNTVYFLQKPYVSMAWRFRLLAGMTVRLPVNLLIDEQPLRGLQFALKGVWHGLRGRLGPYPS